MPKSERLHSQQQSQLCQVKLQALQQLHLAQPDSLAVAAVAVAAQAAMETAAAVEGDADNA
jgi:predicted transcriptional regulator